MTKRQFGVKSYSCLKIGHFFSSNFFNIEIRTTEFQLIMREIVYHLFHKFKLLIVKKTWLIFAYKNMVFGFLK